MYLRRNTRTKFEFSIDKPLNINWKDNELLLSDIFVTEVDIISRDLEYEVDKELLHVAMEELFNREKNCRTPLRLYSGNEEKTQKEVSDLLGISQSYISRLEKKIIRRLKKLYRMVVE